MSVFWFALGAAIGFAIAWYFLTRKCIDELADRDRDIAKLELELATAKAGQPPVERSPAEQSRDDGDLGPVGFASLDIDGSDVESDDAPKIASPETESLEGAGESERPDDKVPESNGADSATAQGAAVQDVTGQDDLADAELAALGRPGSPLNADSLNVSADDLTRIKGIGPVLKNKLSDLGIVTFRQIAEFTPADIERVNAKLDFPGRIEREKWVEQAKEFSDG